MKNSKENVESFVRSLLSENDDLSAMGNCRNSALKISEEIKVKFPNITFKYLTYPEAGEGFGVHYSLLFSTMYWKLLVNPVPAPGFPKYIGDPELAHPLFSLMVESEEVI